MSTFLTHSKFATPRLLAVAAIWTLVMGSAISGAPQQKDRGTSETHFSGSGLKPAADANTDGGIAGEVPGACGDTTLTQSTDSTTMLAGNSVACNAGGVTSLNGYARSFAIAPGPNFVVNCVDFGVEANSGAAYVVTCNIYTGTIPGPVAGLTLLGSLPVTIPAGTALTNFKADFVAAGASVSVPGGSNMVVEILAPSRLIAEGGDGTGGLFIGSNPAGQSAPSYIRAPGCGVPDFVTTAFIGFPGMHITMRVDGGAMFYNVISVCNDTGVTAADLHMTFAGALGTVFVNPGLVFAPGCPTPVVPSNAAVTNTVVIDWGMPCVPSGGAIAYVVRTAGGPITFAAGNWTSPGGGIIGPVNPACVVINPVGVGGIGGGIFPPPPGFPFWAVKIRERYTGDVAYGPWAKPPGQCWQRWCCFPNGVTCEFRVFLCLFPNRFNRVFEIPGALIPPLCFPITGWITFRVIPGPIWILQLQTWRPPPGDPQDPPGGPPPRRPPPNAPVQPNGSANLSIRFSDDNGNTFHNGADFTQSFLNIFASMPITTNNPALPPILGFQNMVMAMAPGYDAAGFALMPLLNELNIVQAAEPSALLNSIRLDVQQLQNAMFNINTQMAGGFPVDPTPFQMGAQSLYALANHLQAMPPIGQPRFAHAAQQAAGMADGLALMAAQVPTGFPTPVEQDAFFWGHFARLVPLSEHFAEEMFPHIRIQLQLQGMNGWYEDAVEQVLVKIADDFTGQQLDEQYFRMNDKGEIDIPIMAYDPARPLRIWLKPPTHLAVQVVVPPIDGQITGPITAIAGDADGDNCVDNIDLALVLADQGQGGEFALSVPPTDVDFDGFVGPGDAALVSQNLGICGAVQGCVPDIAPPGGNGIVNIDDLLLVINSWGPCAGCPADVDNNGVVNIDDLLAIINGWGPCAG